MCGGMKVLEMTITVNEIEAGCEKGKIRQKGKMLQG